MARRRSPSPSASSPVAVVAAAALLLAAPVARAAPPTKAECLAAYTDGQDQRQHGALRQARAEFAICASDPCPEGLHADCTQWHDEVEKLVPSVVLGARGPDGHELTGVRVTMDGAPLVDRLDGRAVEIDPGQHTFHFETDGQEPVDRSTMLREGEKARGIVVVFGATAAAGGDVPRSRPVTWPTWLLGGVAVVSLGVFAYAGISGLSRYDACNPAKCQESDKSYVDTRWTLADVTGAVALVSAGLATYFFLARPSVTVAPSATTGGAALFLRGTF
jgi:hypothetical protein